MSTTNSSSYPPVFLRLRTIAFSAISFFNFLWIVLLCIIIFVQWENMDRAEGSITLVMLFTNTITLVMLLILLLRVFRPWLDAARFFLLLMAHIGVAGTFAYWSSRFTCPKTSPDEEGVCELLILYILISSWIVPILAILYAVGLGVMVHHRSRQSREEDKADKITTPSESDQEKGLQHRSHSNHHSTSHLSSFTFTPTTPIMASPATITSPPESGWGVGRESETRVPTMSYHNAIPEAYLEDQNSADSRSSARLSKPPPSSRMPSL